MTHQIDLNLAVREGIISPEQATELATLASRDVVREVSDTHNGNEPFRLIGGFNDIFVTIGIVLVLAGAAFALEALGIEPDWAPFAIMAAMIWLLAEYISRVRRMKLPSTVLAINFAICVSALLQVFLEQRFDFTEPENAIAALVFLDQMQTAGLIAFMVHLLVAMVYFWRFRVPIEAAILALAATGLVTIGASELFMDEVARGQVRLTSLEDVMGLIQQLLILPLICGLVIFAVGVWLDFRDRERTTTLSDAAFWLHLLSAPMIVHPLFELATGRDLGFGELEPGTWAGLMLFGLMAVFVLVSLAIDRRSLLIPTLGYFGALGIAEMVGAASENTGIPPFALILLVMGALIIIFGVGWQRIRALVIGNLLPKSWLAALPPIRV